jgi:AhpD family alkylhydroperoxidase
VSIAAIRRILTGEQMARRRDERASQLSQAFSAVAMACELLHAERKDAQMNDDLYPKATPEVARRRKELTPNATEAFDNFSKAVFADGALDERTKQLIAVAVAHVTQCPYCITGHSKLAKRKGATAEQIMEAIWVAAEMRAGGAYAHSTIALHAIGEVPDEHETGGH